MLASIREAEATFRVETVMAWLLLTHSAARYSSDQLGWTTAVLPQKQATEQVQALPIKPALGSTHQQHEAMPNENIFKMQAICWGTELT